MLKTNQLQGTELSATVGATLQPYFQAPQGPDLLSQILQDLTPHLGILQVSGHRKIQHM